MTNKLESTSHLQVDDCGLPLDSDVVTPVASSPHNSLGESSNNRSVGLSYLALPPLLSQSSVTGKTPLASSNGFSSMMPPKLKTRSPSQQDQVSSRLASFISSPISCCTWNLPYGCVQPKPAFYPLDPMSEMIMNSNAQSIATRISECLHRLSIKARYEETKAKAKCVSADGVEFHIRLYAGKGLFSEGIIVEIQRRFNWSASYFQDCKDILESAECDHIEDGNHNGPPRISPPAFCPGDFIGNTETIDNSRLALSKLLLFKSNSKLESIIMGLENICSFLDSRKCGKATALSTARAIFLDDEYVNTDVKDLLYDIVVHRRITIPNIDLSQLQEETQCQIFDLAFTSIVMSILILGEENTLCHAIKLNGWIESELIDIVMKQIQSVSSHPQIAVLSSRCLLSITKLSTIATNTTINLGLLSILETKTNLM